MGAREAADARAAAEICDRVRCLRLPLALRVARALAVAGDAHGGPDGELLRRRAVALQKELQGPEDTD